MDTDSLAVELSQMHIDNAKLFTHVTKALSTSGETGVLLWLNQRGKETFAINIIDHFGLTPGRVANIVKKLEQRGYITRLQDSLDLRKARIVLTDKGKSQADKLYCEMNASHAQMLKALGFEDSQRMLEILRRLLFLLNSGIELHSLDIE